MTFNASATKWHKLLEPCTSAAVLSFYFVSSATTSSFTFATLFGSALSLALGSMLQVGDGNGCLYYRTEALRLLAPRYEGGIVVLFLRQNGTWRQWGAH